MSSKTKSLEEIPFFEIDSYGKTSDRLSAMGRLLFIMPAFFSSILVRQKHEELFERFGSIFTETKQHEHSLEDIIETLLMLQCNNNDSLSRSTYC